MTGPIAPAPTVLETYRASLLPIYDQVCGDEMSFDRSGQNFEEFLTIGMIDNIVEHNPQRALAYTRLLQRDADPKTASDLFIKFLEQGNGCHESSPAGIAAAMARGIELAANPKAVHVANGYVFRSHERKLYSEWTGFLRSYMQQIYEVRSVIDGIINEENGPGDLRRAVWQVTNRTVVFARTVGTTLKTLLGAPPKTLIWAILRIEWARINNFRTTVNMLSDSSRPDSRAAEEFYELLDDFRDALDTLLDPFDWLQKVVARYPNEGTSRVKMTVEKSMRRFKSDDAATLWELIDWMFIIADHSGTEEDPVNIDFRFDEEEKLFVITISHLEAPSIAYVDLLARRLGGSRVITHASNDLKKPVIEIRIPLTEAGSDPSTPQGPSNQQDPPAPVITGMTPSGELGSSPYPNISPSMTALQVYYGAQNIAVPAIPLFPFRTLTPPPISIPLRN